MKHFIYHFRPSFSGQEREITFDANLGLAESSFEQLGPGIKMVR